MRSRTICAFLLFALFFAGCQKRSGTTIAVIPKATSHVFWLAVQSGAMAAGEDLGVEVLWNGPPTETDYSRQIQIMDSMIVRRVDGIAVAAAERKALSGSIDRAAAAGIPVVVFDSGVESTNFLSYIATNNLEAGRLGARTLAELAGGKGKVALVMHAPGSASTMEREQGFNEVMSKEYPDIQVVASQFGMSDRAKARAAAENMLTAHPDLDGMFASSEPSSVGAALAIKARGLTKQVALVAFDSSDSMIEDLKEGAIDAMVVQDPQKMGYQAVQTLVDKINGKEVPKQIDLSASVIRKEDLDKPEVQKLLGVK
ncbi:MAG: substrate-binding domain-containing protein [Bryobacteraceae bacterium]